MSQTSIIFAALLIALIITMTMQGTLAQFLGFLGLGNYASQVDQLNKQQAYGPTNTQGQLLYGE